MCGIFGIYGHKDAARLTYLGLYALQHRGQEAAGIVSIEGSSARAYKGVGLVSDVFDGETGLHADEGLEVCHRVPEAPSSPSATSCQTRRRGN